MLKGLMAGFLLVSLCVVVHAFGLVQLADWLIRHPKTWDEKFSVRRYSMLLAVVFVFIILLHLVETLIWASFYFMWQHFDNFETAWYFSLGSYTTVGYGDVVLATEWRMLGGIEGLTGVLLCGLSTAFLFAVVNVMFESRKRHRAAPSE